MIRTLTLAAALALASPAVAVTVAPPSVSILDPDTTDLGAPLGFYGVFAPADGVTIPLPPTGAVLGLSAPTGRVPEWASVDVGGDLTVIAGTDLPALLGISGATEAHVRIGAGGSLLVTLLGDPVGLDVPHPVPLPATGLLMLAALGGVVVASRRRVEAV